MAMKRIKKGKKGEAAAYCTRAQALRKLQLPLQDFRKLCILKGIYPREPKKSLAGRDKTYYHVKDIRFLTHEPLLVKFFELKTFMKKYKRLMGRKARPDARALEERKPEYSLQHIVKERYPTFNEALHDLDDALSMLALFAALPVDEQKRIPYKDVAQAAQLYSEFEFYCARTKCLRKVFASIKGYYFQAEIQGETITWLVPHKFSQDLPGEVDFRVMLTFLEFYRVLAELVNFKLYTGTGWTYPPQRRDAKTDETTLSFGAHLLQLSAGDEAAAAGVQAIADEAGKAEAAVLKDFGDTEEVRAIKKAEDSVTDLHNLFDGLRFFISREVPFGPVHFLLHSTGAAVGWEGPNSPYCSTDERITHHVTDRPPAQIEPRMQGREYIQPQWLLDSFNSKVLLPISPYLPGAQLPPHLSPFVKDDPEEGYVPRQRQVLDSIISNAKGEVETAKAAKVEEGGESASEEEAEEEARNETAFQAQVAQEAAGAASTTVDPKAAQTRKRARTEAKAQEELERAEAMMPKKLRRLKQRIDRGKEEKAEEVQKLVDKREQHEKKQ